MTEALEKLENRVVELESKLKKKDWWDKAAVVFAALTPAVLAVVGYLFTTESQRVDAALKGTELQVRAKEADAKASEASTKQLEVEHKK